MAIPMTVAKLAALSEAGAISDVLVQASGDEWALRVNGQWLETQRGERRMFRKLETLLGLLRSSSAVRTATLEWSFWTPEQRTLV